MRYVQAHGSFYEVGRQVGEACRTDILEIYASGVADLLKHTKVGSIARIDQIAARYLAAAKQLWLPSVEFLRGLAEGAGVPMSVIALTAFMEGVCNEAEALPPEKCSTLVVRLPNGHHLIIHNEDFPKFNFGKMVLLDVVFDGGYPRMVGVVYPGQLWGTISLNSNFLATTSNSLNPPVQPGLPQQVMHCRASLARDMAEAERWLTMRPLDLTTHYVVACGRTREVASLEVSNFQVSRVETDRLVISDVPFFCHTNHIPDGRLKLRLPDPMIKNEGSSFDRYNKLAKLKPAELPRTPQEGFNLFSTPGNNALFRESEEEWMSVTLATVVICPETGELWVRDADPSAAKRDWYFPL